MGHYRNPTATEVALARSVGAQRAAGPVAVAAYFDAEVGRVVLEMGRRCSVAFDPAVCRQLSGASPSELQEIEILGAGTAINFPCIDVSLSLANLVVDLLDSSSEHQWLAQHAERDG